MPKTEFKSVIDTLKPLRAKTEGSVGFPLRGPRQRFPRALYPIANLESLLTRQDSHEKDRC
jgi:hypothetical protein